MEDKKMFRVCLVLDGETHDVHSYSSDTEAKAFAAGVKHALGWCDEDHKGRVFVLADHSDCCALLDQHPGIFSDLYRERLL